MSVCLDVEHFKTLLTNVGAHSLGIKVALLFSDCSNVNLTKVHIIESPGTGVVMYNPLGVVNIDTCKSQFLRNGFSGSDEVMYRGGGLVIDANKATSKLSCTITNSTFFHNAASSRATATYVGIDGC